MKIECKNKREGGSIIDIGGVAYEFKPQADGAHVAEVGNKEHVERFLSIPEAYGLYTPGKKTAPVEQVAPEPVVEEAPVEETVAEVTEENDIEALKAQYKAKFGSMPHYKWSIETIKAKLAE